MTPIRYGASTEEKFTVVLPSTNETVWTEFDQIKAKVLSLLKGQELKINELLEDDKYHHLTYLVGHMQIPRSKLRAFIQSFKLEQETIKLKKPIEAAFFYGLLRGGIASDLPGILAQGPQAIKQAINDALKKLWIPWTIRPRMNEYLSNLNAIRILAVLGDVNNPEISLINEIIKLEIPNKTQRLIFFIQYFKHVYPDGTNDDLSDVDHKTALTEFWNWVQQSYQALYDKLKSTLTIATLVGGDLHLTKKLREIRNAANPQDMSFIAIMIRDNWFRLLEQTHLLDSDFPPGIQGIDLDAKRKSYAKILAAAVEASIPNLVIRERLLIDDGTTEITKKFLRILKANRIYFDFINATIADQVQKICGKTMDDDKEKKDVINEIRTCQILYHLTRKYDELDILKENNIKSAFDIVKKGHDKFVKEYTERLGEYLRAETLYQNAHYITSTVLAVYGQIGPAFNKTQLDVLATISIDNPEGEADWPTLFGSPDYCECKECESVLSSRRISR